MRYYAGINIGLWELFMRTYRYMKKARQRELYEYGITLRNSTILGIIMRLGERATLPNIADEVVLEMNSLSSQLKRMEKDGLIEKYKSMGKRDLMRIRITDKGYESFIQAKNINSIDSIMSALTDEEKNDLWAIMVKIREKAMEESGKKIKDLYPPSDPKDLFHLSEQKATG